MNDVSFKSISADTFNQNSITKQFNNQFSLIPETSFTPSSNYKINNMETKEIINLKKTVNRLEKNISFIQQEHSQMLKGLQQQVEKLREENQELQFQLVMRSSRTGELDLESQINLKYPETAPVMDTEIQSSSHHILKLKEALEEEKAINNELIQKLDFLSKEMEIVKKEVPPNEIASQIRPMSRMKTYGEIDITSNIRISLDPLTMSMYHEDSGQYITNTSPSLEDCEVIIKAFLEKSSYPVRDSQLSNRSFSAQRTPVIPYIKKPLQNIKTNCQNAALAKFNPLLGTLSSKPMGLTSSHTKLSPIISHKNDINKIEKESQRLDISRNSERDFKQGNIPPIAGDNKVGCSLPALPKPNDYNQAEKQRRLHLLQKKRLDNYNNRL